MSDSLGYAQWLRQWVGHTKLIVPGGAGLIRDDRGRVLLQKRSDFGLWGLPGGGMDLGETIQDTVRREVREEVGLDVEPLGLIALQTDPRLELVFPNGDEMQAFGALFECRIAGGALQRQESEVLELGWFAATELPSMTRLAARWIEDGSRFRGETLFDPPLVTRPVPMHEGAPAHVQALRAAVGHAPLILTGAAACIRDDRGRVLLQKRRDNALWGFPGGMQEMGESIAATVVRETREEVGLEVEPAHLIGLYTTPEFGRTYENGDQAQNFIVFFECTLKGGELQAQESEVLEMGWFEPDRLPPLQACCATKARDARDFQGKAFVR